MNGTIPESIGQLRELEFLDLTGCSWEGFISENHFQNTSRLDQFFLSSEASNSLVFNVSHDWIPIFNLTNLYIMDCKLMDTAFPVWLKSQKFLEYLTLKRGGISDTIPHWFWRFAPFLMDVNLSHNQLRGNLPKSVSSHLQHVILTNNSLVGSLPLWPNVTQLSLANNKFSGPIPLNIGHEMSELVFLDLSRNYFSGIIPRDWTGLQDLKVIDFSNNNLSGEIPSSMCSQLPSLKWLRLSNNNLSGNLESSLQTCRNLSALDLTGNNFSGTIPDCIGENLHTLSYLILKANKFTGNIPHQLCDLSSLQVLDLSQNNISGSIPACLGGLKQMATGDGLRIGWMMDFWFPDDPMHIDLNVKGVVYEYIANIIKLIKKFDLSSNNLSGEIPEELKNLMALGSLNLSHNHLTGKIPEGIGSLHELEALDLSSNHLWGLIPSSMTSMTSLSKLNLSFNNFSGPIPSANQFPTFDPTSFEGNSGLCGPPLPTRCSSAFYNDPAAKVEEDEEDKYGKLWFYASTALGFIVGFWVVFGSLVIKRSWRHAYFQFLDNMKDKLCFCFWK
ncbi:receptor-like protein EIX2 [Rosa rugosa]|uniref:receptor-like protein EIX2 n=1 Tax=Rosa rugosa TaxID=74645 RepID=UPI002B40F05A|nr:receptor-like protein EIX2 [Rosa rugosa]